MVCSEDSAVPSEGVKKGPFHRRDAENAEKYAEKTDSFHTLYGTKTGTVFT